MEFPIGSALREACIRHFATTSPLPQRAFALANKVRLAATTGSQIPPLSRHNPDFDQFTAYQVSAALCNIRMSREKAVPVGRKIGFTNTKIWTKYNVHEPNWGYVWNHTASEYKERQEQSFLYLRPHDFDLESRIEPEIIFCLKRQPHSSMTESEALSCVEWMANGFEIVQSIYRRWQFTAADTTAANALHRHLIIGPKKHIQEKDIDNLVAQLASFKIDLCVRKKLIESGVGDNVLGSPIKALLYLCKMLEDQNLHPRLIPGEVIATGTLTDACRIVHGNKWRTELTGIDLPGLRVKIKLDIENRTGPEAPPSQHDSADRPS